MAKTALERQFSTASEDFEDEMLDPRVQVELEKLNKASDDINKLELELDEARASFRQSLTESTQRLNALSKKLGSCIEKARPYYEARMKAKEAQIETQNVALRFERACSQLMAAKEMVYLAELGFFKKGQPFDPAWQEMLNHATIKVNDAEKERLECEVEHQRTAFIFNECEQRVKALQKDLKRNIAKSRPYFEQKARFNQKMEEQKRRVSQLEDDVIEAKKMYSEALRNLERISDEIHQQRRDAKLRDEMGDRGIGVGEEQPAPPPYGEVAGGATGVDHVTGGHVTVSRTNSETQTETGMLGEAEAMLVSQLQEGKTLLNHLNAAVQPVKSVDVPESRNTSNRTQLEQAQIKMIPQAKHVEEHRPNSITPMVGSQCQSQPAICDDVKQLPHSPTSSPAHSRLDPTGSHPSSPKMLNPLIVEDRDRHDGETVSETVSSADVLTPTSGQSSVHTTAVTSPDTENEADTHIESTKTNMEIMESLQKAKNFKSPFLRPNRSREDLLDEASDNESITGSMASMSVLDDEQIESLMLETSDYVNFLSRHGNLEAEKFKSLTLPAKLSYLQNYMHFRPEFIDMAETGSNSGLDDTKGENDKTLVTENPQDDSVDYDGCWSSEICQTDLPETCQIKTSTKDSEQSSGIVEILPPCDETDIEFERVYRELAAFEKERSFSSSDNSPPLEEQDDPFGVPEHAVCVIVPPVAADDAELEETTSEKQVSVAQVPATSQVEGAHSTHQGTDRMPRKEEFV